MMDKSIVETNFEKVKAWTDCIPLGNEMLLIDKLANAPFPTDARRMNFILICLCTKGSVNFTLDTTLQTLHAHELLVVSERHILDHYSASPDFEGLCLMVSMPFYNETMRSVSDISALFLFAHNNPIFKLPQRDEKVFNEYYQLIKQKIKNADNHFRTDLVRTLMLAMFYDLSDLIYRFQNVSKKERLTRGDVIFNQFIKLVEANCRHERRVSWYAEQISITPKYLSEMVKQVSKKTPNEWIDNYVTLELRVILKNTTMSIKDIAKELNFPNQSFLGKYFKEHVGMSPSKYRKS